MNTASTDESNTLEIELASRLDPPIGLRQKWNSRSRIKKFTLENGFQAYWFPSLPESSPVAIHRDSKLKFYSEPNSLIFRVKTKPFRATLNFVDLEDFNNEVFGIRLSGTWRISNPLSFFRKFCKPKLQCFSHFETTSLETELADQLRLPLVHEILDEENVYEELAGQEQALPREWFETFVRKQVADHFDWLELDELQPPEFFSDTGDMRLELEQRTRLKQIETKAKKLQIGQESKIKDLEHSAELSELERVRRINETKREGELAELKFEKEKAELLANIERTRTGEVAANEVLRSFRDSNDRLVRKIEALEEAIQDDARVKASSENFKESGINLNSVENFEHLNFATENISTASLEISGQVSPAVLLGQSFREKFNQNPDSVLVKKIDVLTRDIGTKRVDTIRIGDSLTFEFLSKRSGFVSILNIGTSGRVGLHCPNAFVSSDKARIENSKRIQIPGEGLVPRNQLASFGLDYSEYGPAGWEELAVLVSDEPLFNDNDTFSCHPGEPFPYISNDRTLQLLDQLVNLPSESWDVGTLSFLVVE